MFLKSLPEGDLHFEKHKKCISKFQIETRDPRTRTLNQVVRSINRSRTVDIEYHKPVNLECPETPDTMDKTFFGSDLDPQKISHENFIFIEVNESSVMTSLLSGPVGHDCDSKF